MHHPKFPAYLAAEASVSTVTSTSAGSHSYSFGFGGDGARAPSGSSDASSDPYPAIWPREGRSDSDGLLDRNAQHPSSSSSGYHLAVTMTEEECVKQAKTCSYRGHVTVFAELLPKAEEFSMEAQVLINNYYIHACSQVGEIRRARAHVEDMEARGLRPNLMTYNILLNTFAASGDSQGAQTCIELMKRKHVEPNLVSFSTLCKALARGGMAREIGSVIEGLENGGFEVNEYFFASLVSSLGTQEPPDLHSAELVLPELVVRGIRPTSIRKILGKLIGEVRLARLYSIVGEIGADQSNPSQAIESRMIKAWQLANAILQLQAQDEPAIYRDEPEAFELQRRREAEDTSVESNTMGRSVDEHAGVERKPSHKLKVWRQAFGRLRAQEIQLPEEFLVIRL